MFGFTSTFNLKKLFLLLYYYLHILKIAIKSYFRESFQSIEIYSIMRRCIRTFVSKFKSSFFYLCEIFRKSKISYIFRIWLLIVLKNSHCYLLHIHFLNHIYVFINFLICICRIVHFLKRIILEKDIFYPWSYFAKHMALDFNMIGVDYYWTLLWHKWHRF